MKGERFIQFEEKTEHIGFLIFIAYPDITDSLLFEGDFINLIATLIYNILYTKMSSAHYMY